MKRALLLLVVAACSSAPAPRDAPDPCVGLDAGTYDLGCDFSLERNPNGPWRYGWAADLNAASFVIDRFVDRSNPVGVSHPDASTYYPYLAWNSTAQARVDATDSWAVRPHEVAMEAITGKWAMAQFIVPATGFYKVEVTFEGVHFHHSTTDVHVLLDDREVFTSEIDGYGGFEGYHPTDGTNPAVHSTLTSIPLTEGQVLGFAVGTGTNATNNNDTTGVIARITAQ
jgi:hypothetical protein